MNLIDNIFEMYKWMANLFDKPIKEENIQVKYSYKSEALKKEAKPPKEAKTQSEKSYNKQGHVPPPPKSKTNSLTKETKHIVANYSIPKMDVLNASNPYKYINEEYIVKNVGDELIGHLLREGCITIKSREDRITGDLIYYVKLEAIKQVKMEYSGDYNETFTNRSLVHIDKNLSDKVRKIMERRIKT